MHFQGRPHVIHGEFTSSLDQKEWVLNNLNRAALPGIQRLREYSAFKVTIDWIQNQTHKRTHTFTCVIHCQTYIHVHVRIYTSELALKYVIKNSILALSISQNQRKGQDMKRRHICMILYR